MEYGLMLGFNKYVIPFQREDQSLPFNIAALDTIKYNTRSFKALAEKAIREAIAKTSDKPKKSVELGDVMEIFLASRDVYLSGLVDDGEKNLFHMGNPLGFHLLNHFDGITYLYLGNFFDQRSNAVIYRIQTLEKLLHSRLLSIPARIKWALLRKNKLLLLPASWQNFKYGFCER